MSERTPGDLWERIEPLLLRVERPSRYLGCEWDAPGIAGEGTTVVLAYPDLYEVGISNLGLAILQDVVNDIEGASCERVYSPWFDMEREMRSAGLPLFSLETHRAVSTYDIFGISIPHELTYTNIINLLDLAGISLRADNREEGPLVIGGGCGTANPEPLAPFLDLFVLGEGEEVLDSLVRLVSEGKSRGWDRRKLLSEASRLEGVYQPSDYEVDYRDDGLIERIEPVGGAPERVRKRTVDLNEWLYPRHPIVPFCEAVHDRINVEIFRGCTRGCRFCQAGMICRPVRERSVDAVVGLVDALAVRTGHEEVALSSLSSTDYTMIKAVTEKVSEICEKRRMILSLPSLRMDGFSVELASSLELGGRGSFTFAPETGTERLRRVINKPISEKDIIDAVLCAVRAGRRRIKLYFMIGLPTETDEDVEAIGRLVFGLRDTVRGEGMVPPVFNVSVSTFVPKPHTPFQWVKQENLESIERKQGILRETLRAKGINLSWHDSRMSTVESLLARGDRRLADVIEYAWASGCRFDSWSEHFDYARWEAASEKAGVDPEFYLYREREPDEVFPWEHLDFGPDRDFLYEEYQGALRGETSPDCRGGKCRECGVSEEPGACLVLTGTWSS
ncbi:MAG: TIGR03960 family B12-binding radical SAM protein [Actinobacteria bacterium]|nr:TIGR03960 family B12-binding radical SAM protein [Actinomycetota bacterium]